MAATTATLYNLMPAPGGERDVLFYITASTADSADTLDISGDVRDVDWAIGWDDGTGTITVTESSLTLTIDSGGGRTNNAYGVLVVGKR